MQEVGGGRRTSDAICDNGVSRIIASLRAGAELHSRTEDIDKFALSLCRCNVNLGPSLGDSIGALEGFHTSSPHCAPITIVAIVS